MNVQATTVLLLAVSTAVALGARALKIPFTVALVLAGLALGATHLLPAPKLTRDLLYTVFLPGLIFEAAFHLTFEDLRQNKILMGALAFPGVLVAVALTTGLLVLIPGTPFVAPVPWVVALAFAALISATDPVAVVGLFKSLGAPKRLGVLIDGESLLNDGTAVVVYTLVLRFAAGGEFTPTQAAWDFARIVGVGCGVGAAFGFVITRITARIDEPLVEITLSTIAAYGSFVTAEHFQVSGILATVTAGVLCGNLGPAHATRAPNRLAVESFWEYVAFALNSLVFLLIGLEVSLSSLRAYWKPIVVAYGVITLTRALIVFACSATVRRTRERIPWRWGFVLTWGGLRGALSMVLALVLPQDFPQRQLVISTAFGVVIVSLLVNGLTTAPLLRWSERGRKRGNPVGLPVGPEEERP